jgi:hypothetical protein
MVGMGSNSLLNMNQKNAFLYTTIFFHYMYRYQKIKLFFFLLQDHSLFLLALLAISFLLHLPIELTFHDHIPIQNPPQLP